MKKLNNKGFTLVELLAVIIILAIVVGISIPAITNVINDSKNNAMGVAVDAASDYLTDQYSYMNIDVNSVSKEFYDTFGESPTDEQQLDPELVKQAGFDLANVEDVYATLKPATGKICVRIEHILTTSEYYTTKYWNTDQTAKTGSGVKNSNCD